MRGADVLVLEEHEQVGIPDHCAGLLSTSGLASLGLRPPPHVVQNHINGAIIHSPSGHSIFVERGQREALVVDRREFDRWLAERAIDKGVGIRTKAKVRGLMVSKGVNGVRVGKDGEKIHSTVVINAEGSRCIISREAGLPIIPRQNMFPAYQFEVSNANVHEDIVEMFYGNRVAPGFFAWIIPLGEGRARVGLASRDRSKIRLRAAIRHHPSIRERVGRAKIDRGFGGIVLVGLPVNRTYTSGLLTVGDAAGIVKATTGGGVIIGGGAAQIAGVVAAQAVEGKKSQASKLMEYERLWRAKYQGDLRAMYLTQKIIGSLSDKGLDILIENAAALGLVDTVKSAGDMDMQGRVIMRLLRKPETLIAGLRVVRHLNLIYL